MRHTFTSHTRTRSVNLNTTVSKSKTLLLLFYNAYRKLSYQFFLWYLLRYILTSDANRLITRYKLKVEVALQLLSSIYFTVCLFLLQCSHNAKQKMKKKVTHYTFKESHKEERRLWVRRKLNHWK